ncbi:hypothetical protein PLESTM_001848900 [Pleodorina starrii]|nr:hypothetical protein PLESTM_001848900 [Pleodorina starrii]
MCQLGTAKKPLRQSRHRLQLDGLALRPKHLFDGASKRLPYPPLAAPLPVFVNWTEIPGSKIRFTSILLMALELIIIKD